MLAKLVECLYLVLSVQSLFTPGEFMVRAPRGWGWCALVECMGNKQVS